MKYIDTTVLNNIITFLFMLYPFFMYKVNNLDNVNKNDSWLKLKFYVVYVGYSLLLISPALWLLLNGQLVNMLLGMMVLGVYYFFKGVWDHVR